MKGVILAGGYGTRFLPVTKTIPKEMLPLVNKPAIAFIMEEFAAAGINEVLIISSRRKRSLEDYFDREVELEGVFSQEQKHDYLAQIAPERMQVYFTRQQKMMGTGHALMQAEAFVGSDPFVVAYPDDLHFGATPLAAQLVETFHITGKTVMAGLDNPPNLERYGVLSLADDNLHVTDIVEKPAPGTAPSRLASIGRYLYTPEIFGFLQEGWAKHLAESPESEYYHVYALKQLMSRGRVVQHTIEGERLDTGAPTGFLQAFLHVAAQDPELATVIREFAAGM
ncbi:UTP--glucose-1-phosphate uridylyltransferase [Spirochaeta africana]|uniref:UTP--glucose-1-phosphate uridylyltransferase n=1 Tax=Spirochaeta africana (strain ATCC 700263 / DSM 8902 / Z-7692) TaxID=889378 RepID=H9UFS5_SPIAZ|nr:UTP--glucose-1-phosphate uridylyltransferase [Spirochaeta africana]AFG36368.1 UDP-glucose pyrophosphorylase [Spirochaeta africana DSM 8902]